MDSLTQGSAERGPNGLRIVRSAIITGLTGPPESKIPDALNAVGLPRYGDPHPSPLAAGLPLTHMIADILENESDKAIVTLTYEYVTGTGGINVFENVPSETTAPQSEVTTTLNQLVTNFDAFGNVLTVQHTFPLAEGEPGPPAPVVQTGEVTKMVPTTTRNYMRREPKDPGDKAKIYVGKVGVAGLGNPLLFGDPDRYWLCTGLGGPSDDGGVSFNVTYSFQRAEPHSISGFDIAPGWDTVIVFIDPATDKPPENLIPGTGIKIKQVYLTAPFGNLRLTTA